MQAQLRITRLNNQLTRGLASLTPKVNFNNTENVVGVNLNNPKALNALDLDMIDLIETQLPKWNDQANGPSVVYFKGEGPKAFCAGGDIMSLYKAREAAAEGEKPQILDTFFRREFLLDYALATMNPIQVALWDGIVMGGGVGLTIHAPVKIATEKSVFAMPEAKIGFFTDVGGGFFLSQLEKNIGMYLGLTSDTIKGKDLVRAGVANHYIPSEKIEKFENDLINGISKQNAQADLDALLAQYSEPVDGEFPNSDSINELFGDTSLVGIIHSLRQDSSDFSKRCQKLLTQVSPLSLRIIYDQINRAQNGNLRDAFITDFRIAQRCMEASEFFEGVRCLLVDRKDTPQWKYERAAWVPQAEVDSYFEPFDLGSGNRELEI